MARGVDVEGRLLEMCPVDVDGARELKAEVSFGTGSRLVPTTTARPVFMQRKNYRPHSLQSDPARTTYTACFYYHWTERSSVISM